MVVFMFVLAYVATGLGSLIIIQRIIPEKFFDCSWADRWEPVAVVLGWPLAWLGTGIVVIDRVNKKTISDKTKARDELERELAVARREVDDLLRGRK